MENVLGRGEQYCKGDGVGTKLSQWGPVRPVCERDSAGYRQESPCESWLVAGKQRPVDKGNLGLSHLHSGVFMEQGQGKHGHWLFLPAVWVPSPTSEQSYPCVLMYRLF